jgi:hypothetical protein
MKIFVVSTPKTGNTWISALLSSVYDLKPVVFPTTFQVSVAEEMGSDWVTLQHYRPRSELLHWAEENQALFVTMVRHPGDVLTSLWHMMCNRSYDPRADLRYLKLLMHDDDQMGEHAREYVEQHFHRMLRLSLRWVNAGLSLVVRYEDLWRDPVATLTSLTDRIEPVSRSRIESAVDLCDIRLLRKLRDDPEGKFFRKGGPGNWRYELPESILDVFRHQDPYPALFDALGYTLDPHDPLVDAPKKPRQSTNPFVKRMAFDNGVEVPIAVVKLYLLLDPVRKEQWFETATATAPGSFYAWLNAPAGDDPFEGQRPVITNLAHRIHRERADLQRAFPDPFGEDRHAFARWFVTHAQTEHDLDPVFIRTMRDSMEVVSQGLSVGSGIVLPPLASLRRKLSSWMTRIRARMSLHR